MTQLWFIYFHVTPSLKGLQSRKNCPPPKCWRKGELRVWTDLKVISLCCIGTCGDTRLNWTHQGLRSFVRLQNSCISFIYFVASSSQFIYSFIHFISWSNVVVVTMVQKQLWKQQNVREHFLEWHLDETRCRKTWVWIKDTGHFLMCCLYFLFDI